MIQLLPDVEYFMKNLVSIQSQSFTVICTSDFNIAVGFMPTQLITSSESTLI